MNKLLLDQLLRVYGSLENIPPEQQALLMQVSDTYDHFQQGSGNAGPTGVCESEAQVKVVIDNPILGIACASTSGRVLQANETFCNLVEYSQEELYQKHFREITHPEDFKREMQLIEKLFNGDWNNYFIEKRYVSKSGKVIWVELNLTAVKNEKGEIERLMGLVQNITRRKQIEAELIRSEANLRNILDNTDTAYALLDTDARIVSMNHVAYKLAESKTGRRVEPGEKYIELMPEQRKAAVDQAIRQVLQHGQPTSYEVNYTWSGEPDTWLYVHMHPIVNAGEVVGLSIGADDITARKKQELRLKEQNERIRKFSFITSHELRHEFSKILMLIEAIKLKQMSQEDFKEFFKEVEITSGKMNQVIAELNRNLNNAAGITAGHTIALHTAAEVCLIDDDKLTNTLNARLIKHFHPQIPVTVYEDIDEALAGLSNEPGKNRFIFLDLNFGKRTGWEFLDAYLKSGHARQATIVILSSSIDPEDFKRASEYPEVHLFLSKPLTAATVTALH